MHKYTYLVKCNYMPSCVDVGGQVGIHIFRDIVDLEMVEDSPADKNEAEQTPTNTTKANICPECGGEVLINKPSGNGFCIECDYTVSGKQ